MTAKKTPAAAAAAAVPSTTPIDEPGYAKLVGDLAVAETDARSTSSDANEARGRRSTVAVATIRAVIREKVDVEALRNDLIDAGILKGTVSKIITIVTGVRNKIINISDVNSLNGAYVAVKAAQKAIADGEAIVAAAFASPSGLITSTAAPAVKAITPDEALKIIISVITDEKDPDKAYALGGDWITKITTAIGTALKTLETDDDE